jgi:exodeoxyribonuclease VIII
MSELEPVRYGMDEAAYHAHPALSSTRARQLLASPALYHYGLTHPSPARTVFDVGTAAHSKVLGVGSGVIAYPAEHLTPSGNVSTKAATVEWAAEQRAAGLVPVSPDDITAVDGMAEAVLAHREARWILEHAQHREASLFATDPATGIDMRARFDIYDDTECGDLKSAVDASPRGFAKAAWNHRYDVQQEHYLKTHELAVGGRPRFRFIAVEKTPPYLVAVYELDEQWQEIGDVWATAARKILRACTDADQWPGYGTETHTLTPPVGLIYEHQDRFEQQEMVVA